MAAKYTDDSGTLSHEEARIFVWTELLPGIEDFLCHVLAKEKLSEGAEELRQYFIERFDIIKLPPSLPPRPNRPICKIKTPPVSPPGTPELKREPTPIPTIPSPEEHAEFAAYQRKLARSLLSPTGSTQERIKVYDDIDHSSDSDDDLDGRKDQNLYEIPIDRENGSEKVNEKEIIDSNPPSSQDIKLDQNEVPPAPLPPPLPPPRANRQTESGSRDSTCSDDKPPDVPSRRPMIVLKCDLQEYQTDGNDSDDGTSYESYDEIEAEKYNKRSVSLPSKHFKNRKHKTLSKSRSSSNWELNIPYSKLEDVVLSGELYYRGVLTWSRKLVAISNRLLICYKPEKDGKPSMVIQLAGYNSTYSARDNQKGFEIKLVHEFAETYHFAVDFKDWAETWCEYINAVAKHSQPPGPYLHLARSVFREDEKNGLKDKAEMNLSASNLSVGSSDTGSIDSTTKKKKRMSAFTGNHVIRMGSFAQKATQFFESIGKKANVKRLLSSGSDSQEYDLRVRPISMTSSSNPELSRLSTDIPEVNENPLGEITINIKHKGYLNIYSSFNKRKWGQRWCLVRENMFQCYKNERSSICELDFLLCQCVLQRAVEETKSELGLMILEGGIEKLTIEPLSKEEMRPWLRVLIHETATEKVPDGLMEYYVEKDYCDVPLKFNTSDLSALIENTFMNFCMDTDFNFNDSRDDTSHMDTSFEDKLSEEHEYILPGQEENGSDKKTCKEDNQTECGSHPCSADTTLTDSSAVSKDKEDDTVFRDNAGQGDNKVIKRTLSDSGDLYTEVTRRSTSSASSRKVSVNSIPEEDDTSCSKKDPKKGKNKARKKRSKNKNKKKENKGCSVRVKDDFLSSNEAVTNSGAHIFEEMSQKHNLSDTHLKNSCHSSSVPGTFPISLNITSIPSISTANVSNFSDSVTDVCSLTSGDYDLVHNSTCTCHSQILSSSHIYHDVNSNLSHSFNSDVSHSSKLYDHVDCDMLVSPKMKTTSQQQLSNPSHSSPIQPKGSTTDNSDHSSPLHNTSKQNSSHLSAILESCQQNVNVQFCLPLKSIDQSCSPSPSPSPSRTELTIDRSDDDTRPDSGIIMDGEDSSKGDNSEEALDSISRGTDVSDEIYERNFIPENLLVDIDKYTDNEQIVRRIEMLRRELVDIKKKRIEIRDKRLTASNDERQSYEEKFHVLSQECRTVTEEIDLLCKHQKKIEQKRICGLRS